MIKKTLTFIVLFWAFFSFAQYTNAEFPGGKSAFQKEFLRMIDAYVDTKIYSVDGKFTFIIDIDENGKPSNLKIFPRVKHDQEFKEDMTFALNKIKKKWKPATKDGKPVKSNFIFEINFTTDYADHGD